MHGLTEAEERGCCCWFIVVVAVVVVGGDDDDDDVCLIFSMCMWHALETAKQLSQAGLFKHVIPPLG